MVTAVRKMLACFNDRLDSYNGLVWYDYSQLRNLFKIPSQPFLFVLLRICLQIFSRHCVIIYKKVYNNNYYGLVLLLSFGCTRGWPSFNLYPQFGEVIVVMSACVLFTAWCQ